MFSRFPKGSAVSSLPCGERLNVEIRIRRARCLGVVVVPQRGEVLLNSAVGERQEVSTGLGVGIVAGHRIQAAQGTARRIQIARRIRETFLKVLSLDNLGADAGFFAEIGMIAVLESQL